MRVQASEALNPGSTSSPPPPRPTPPPRVLPSSFPEFHSRLAPWPADRRVHALPLTHGALILLVSRLVPLGLCEMLRRLLLVRLLSFRHSGCGNGCSKIWRAVRKGHTSFPSASGWAMGAGDRGAHHATSGRSWMCLAHPAARGEALLPLVQFLSTWESTTALQ